MNSAQSNVAKVLAALLPMLTFTTLADAQNSGRVGAVNLEATGTPPGAGPRTLSIGTNVIYKEKVQTSAQGSTQILFPDTSTLNVGRNSSIVIDEFVYDPNTGTGKLVATISKGVLRFVGGQISHTAGVTIASPVATLGIRGGVATIYYPIPAGFGAGDPNFANAKGELVIGGVGTSTLKNNAGEVVLLPGYATFVTGPNDPIREPFRISDAVLAQIMNRITSRPGQTGGVPVPPTDQMAARLGNGTTVLTDPTRPPGSDPLGYISIFDGGTGAAKNNAQAGQTTTTVTPPGSSPVTSFPNRNTYR